jgi:hypothetical protein
MRYFEVILKRFSRVQLWLRPDSNRGHSSGLCADWSVAGCISCTAEREYFEQSFNEKWKARVLSAEILPNLGDLRDKRKQNKASELQIL